MPPKVHWIHIAPPRSISLTFHCGQFTFNLPEMTFTFKSSSPTHRYRQLRLTKLFAIGKKWAKINQMQLLSL